MCLLGARVRLMTEEAGHASARDTGLRGGRAPVQASFPFSPKWGRHSVCPSGWWLLCTRGSWQEAIVSVTTEPVPPSVGQAATGGLGTPRLVSGARALTRTSQEVRGLPSLPGGVGRAAADAPELCLLRDVRGQPCRMGPAWGVGAEHAHLCPPAVWGAAVWAQPLGPAQVCQSR